MSLQLQKKEPIYNCNIYILFKMSHTVSAAPSSCNQTSTHCFYNYSFNCCDTSKAYSMSDHLCGTDSKHLQRGTDSLSWGKLQPSNA